MYQNRVSENVKIKTNQSSNVVSNPIYRELPNIGEINEKQQYWHRVLSSIMFWTLAIVAVSLFYRALSSLML